MFSVRTYVTYENIICPNLCDTRNMMSGVRTYITYENVCNVWTLVAHENMMSRVRTYVTSKMCYDWTFATHEYEIIFCPN